MAGFINLIDKRCLHFNAFIQAQKAEIDDKKRKLWAYNFFIIKRHGYMIPIISLINCYCWISEEKNKMEMEIAKSSEEGSLDQENLKKREEITR